MTINVLFLAAESEPFVKIGGLGDVAGALPNAIHRLAVAQPGSPLVDIRMVLPYHGVIKQKGFPTVFLGEFSVYKQKEAIPCQVYRYDGGPIPVYLLDGSPIDEG